MTLLRRFKRGRAIGTGPVPPEGQASAPVATPPTTAPAGQPADAATQVIGHAAASTPRPGEGAGTATTAGTASALASPRPAGLDPAAGRPLLGRRGRLRRRLRFLRRARDLMLRDLGGLVYEVHRTGGGSSEQHASVIAAKVQRLDALDGEARALEAVLATPRADAVVFEPGVGGTCAACGEIHGSDARFCSTCGAPIGAKAPAMPRATPAPQASADPATESDRRRSFWSRRAAGSDPTPPHAADPGSTPPHTEPAADPGSTPPHAADPGSTPPHTEPAADPGSTPPHAEPAGATATPSADQRPAADTAEFTWPDKPADEPPADQADDAIAARPEPAADMPTGKPRS